MNKVLTIRCHRLFSKGAREYMVAYSILDNNNSEEEVDNNNSDENGKQNKTPNDSLPNRKDCEAIQESQECCGF
jgi:hypothetical protein